MLRVLQVEGLALTLSPEAFERAYPVHDFESFFAWFEAQRPLKADFELYGHIARLHVERLKVQRVVYAELFVASISLDVDRALDEVARLRETVDACESGQIQVEFLNAWRRNRDMESTEQIATRNIRLFEAGLICGVAVAGPEPGSPIARIARVMDRYHEAGLPIEIHAAEWCGPESVWDALEHGHPRRIGHGTHAFDDPALVERLVEREVHVEMCPTSNLRTGSIARIEDHPIRRAFDAGLDVSVSTDDPGAFGCSMDSEYALLAERFGFTADELIRLGANGVRARFQPELRMAGARALASAGRRG